MLILGIDPGTATTGYGLIKVRSATPKTASRDGDRGKDRVLELLDYGLIETEKDGTKGERLAKIYEQFTVLVKKHKPGVMAIERIFFFSNAKTVINVGQAQGVLWLAAQQMGVQIFEYTPGQVKLNVGGSGKADKNVMKKVVFDMFNIEAPVGKKTHFDNVADAIAIAVCHSKLAREVKK
ncbi:MAG: hypothetical protein A3D24_04025 [Candidatus Blackburnbacteria bacterium RIFCSPHIGHO2_02_FULL_39_13]|uniref:Crossover junction endodeoxyribonuclease RuvC n=1 Tax=Candidatus Blackburnbacteria bacterium RIFCSPLOWO2_01_FULL_40_20 TaxID=1797519 RepID=A0A1G1VCX2_9BACT|nr:MAG: Crossover junction endodeoxyribonuclease RuvC [Microgenomates group bacterium GW2011_GWA2_39_19]OGY06968.1 MAG: hypothetical protein A2694_02520 [Candidatus Blackburnbacteria bacterium RIFCSPHIGHO2_01_FULL_40_17]OGY09634.1 MAG: hypothetical protein A3D24_04025 [Candidatus Blackburnbacteria bacterium RIFCSPHIGHO2_02_FULL_39_13]OGY13225.1 MAG: hypothetical protein A3A77_01470 [Candidatus Blackburnbacteria bacterium RIFCSPLOWO2_01_FULL_40_20]HBL52379.1 crossover junction endodeoxyribonucle